MCMQLMMFIDPIYGTKFFLNRHPPASLVPRPHPRKEGKESGDLGKNFGPVDNPRRNLRVPIRSQL